jgi:transposase
LLSNSTIEANNFGGIRKGKRGKVAVFSLLKGGDRVYKQSSRGKDTLIPAISQKIEHGSIVYTDCFRAYNALDMPEVEHFRIKHSQLFAENHKHINGVESFWDQAKRHMRKFNGIPRQHFNLCLKGVRVEV